MQAENTFAMGVKYFAYPHGSQEILNQASKRLNINSLQTHLANTPRKLKASVLQLMIEAFKIRPR